MSEDLSKIKKQAVERESCSATQEVAEGVSLTTPHARRNLVETRRLVFEWLDKNCLDLDHVPSQRKIRQGVGRGSFTDIGRLTKEWIASRISEDEELDRVHKRVRDCTAPIFESISKTFENALFSALRECRGKAELDHKIKDEEIERLKIELDQVNTDREKTAELVREENKKHALEIRERDKNIRKLERLLADTRKRMEKMAQSRQAEVAKLKEKLSAAEHRNQQLAELTETLRRQSDRGELN